MEWILFYSIIIFLTGLTGFSGYFLQAFLMKACKYQSPSATKNIKSEGIWRDFSPLEF